MDKDKHAIITIGDNQFVLPISSSSHNLGDDITVLILKDGTRLEIGTSNVIVISGKSEVIEAMLEMVNTNFYTPNKDKQGKVKMKKISTDKPFTVIKGGKNG